MLKRPARRIVTGNGPDGRSRIVEDGPSPARLTNAGRPGYVSANFWRTSPGDGAETPDSVLQQQGVLPPLGGTIIRVADIPPEPSNIEEVRRQFNATLKSGFSDATHDATSPRHPGMHTTETIDYAIVLEGEIIAIMDEGETAMRAGDVLIQRGTNHAWANRSGRMCRIVWVLCSTASVGP